MTSGREDREAVKGYLSGKPEAARIVDSHIESAFNRWRSRFGYETDDIISDCRYKLFVSLQRNEFTFASSLKTYINSIVNHTCIDYIRFRNRVKPVDLEGIDLVDGGETADRKLERMEAGRVIFRVLRMVPKDCLTLWQMVLKRRMKYREIAESMGKSETNIRRRLWECRDAARTFRDVLEKRANISELRSPL